MQYFRPTVCCDLVLSVACWQMDPGSALRFWLPTLYHIWNRAHVYLCPRWLLNTGFGDSSSSSDWYSGCISAVNPRKSKNLSSLDLYFSFFIIGRCVCARCHRYIYATHWFMCPFLTARAKADFVWLQNSVCYILSSEMTDFQTN